MTANPSRLVSSATSGVDWHWLMSGADMAALASGSWLLPPDPPAAADQAARDWTCSPRIATRTPGTDARSVRAARDFIVTTLRRWDAQGRGDDIAVVVSELLTNALRHTLPCRGGIRPPCPIRLGLLQCGPCVLCAVADASGMPPVPAEPAPLAESGRGLGVIGALSDCWGYTVLGDMGKVVWATFSAEPESAHGGPWCPAWPASPARA
jgi:Histidine kinase-like ATPase domain